MSAADGAGIRRLVFWQPIVSPHQRDFLEILQARHAGEVILAAERPLPEERLAQGWPQVVHERVPVVDVSGAAGFERLVAHDRADTLHLFSGFFSHPTVWRAFRRLVPSAARLGIVSEAPQLGPLAGPLKIMRGRLLVRRYGDRFALVLPMGAVGRRFFAAVGFPPARLATFGYHVAVPDLAATPEPAPGPVRIVAAGQLIRRKGFDLLLDALTRLPAGGWECDLFGAGPLGRGLERRAARQAATRFRGTVPHAALVGELAGADLAVVPSRHDGWGMLVNEALGAGTPVVCTDACGAADLIDDPVAGAVVPAGDVAALAEVLRRAVEGGKIDGARRARVHAVARRHGPEGAVERFLALVAAIR